MMCRLLLLVVACLVWGRAEAATCDPPCPPAEVCSAGKCGAPVRLDVIRSDSKFVLNRLTLGGKVGYSVYQEHRSQAGPAISKQLSETGAYQAGLAVRLGFPWFDLEWDILYSSSSLHYKRDGEAEYQWLTLPVMGWLGQGWGRFGIEAGLGLEPRFLLGIKEGLRKASESGMLRSTEGIVFYLPVGIGASVDLGSALVTLQARYARAVSSVLDTPGRAWSEDLVLVLLGTGYSL